MGAVPCRAVPRHPEAFFGAVPCRGTGFLTVPCRAGAAWKFLDISIPGLNDVLNAYQTAGDFGIGAQVYKTYIEGFSFPMEDF